MQGTSVFVTADGTEIHNTGAHQLTLCTLDWQYVTDMEYLFTDVHKALGPVSSMVRKGNRFAFDPTGRYMENFLTSDRIALCEDSGVYVVDVLVAPQDFDDTVKNQD